MQRNHILMLAAMGSLLTGCANTSQIDLQAPMKFELGKPGSSPGSITIRSGQMIVLDKTYCPPVQLRDANGVVVRELIGHTRPQELVVPPGVYTIVGHAPTAGEWTCRIQVTSD